MPNMEKTIGQTAAECRGMVFLAIERTSQRPEAHGANVYITFDAMAVTAVNTASFSLM